MLADLQWGDDDFPVYYMKKSAREPFPTVAKLADYWGCKWKGYELAATATETAEKSLLRALSGVPEQPLLDPDSALVLFGSFARYEMLKGSDCDWSLLIDGVVNIRHTALERTLVSAIQKAGLKAAGATRTFGNMIFSHELVHCIGGAADSNKNLTIRMLLLLESRCVNLSPMNSHVWKNIVHNILARYFEEDVHFRAKQNHRVPRFLLNDLTRYWRTICVDYAAKYRERDGEGWALRNAKLRFSRKLLYAAGLAFCLSCELDPPTNVQNDLFGLPPNPGAKPYIESAIQFALTPPLEYLAAFVDTYVQDTNKRKKIATRVFGSYNNWLILLNDAQARLKLEELPSSDARNNPCFKKVRDEGKLFARGLQELFFNRDGDTDPIAKLSLDYVGF
jgi:hypothetical protein